MCMYAEAFRDMKFFGDVRLAADIDSEKQHGKELQV